MPACGESSDSTETHNDEAGEEASEEESTTISPEGPGAALACEEAFGNVPGFELCESSPISCTFAVDSQAVTICSEVCEQRGAACVSGYTAGSTACFAEYERLCGGSEPDICICENGCANGEYCEAGMVCTDGVCVAP